MIHKYHVFLFVKKFHKLLLLPYLLWNCLEFQPTLPQYTENCAREIFKSSMWTPINYINHAEVFVMLFSCFTPATFWKGKEKVWTFPFGLYYVNINRIYIYYSNRITQREWKHMETWKYTLNSLNVNLAQLLLDTHIHVPHFLQFDIYR